MTLRLAAFRLPLLASLLLAATAARAAMAEPARPVTINEQNTGPRDRESDKVTVEPVKVSAPKSPKP